MLPRQIAKIDFVLSLHLVHDKGISPQEAIDVPYPIILKAYLGNSTQKFRHHKPRWLLVGIPVFSWLIAVRIAVREQLPSQAFYRDFLSRDFPSLDALVDTFDKRFRK